MWQNGATVPSGALGKKVIGGRGLHTGLITDNQREFGEPTERREFRRAGALILEIYGYSKEGTTVQEERKAPITRSGIRKQEPQRKQGWVHIIDRNSFLD